MFTKVDDGTAQHGFSADVEAVVADGPLEYWVFDYLASDIWICRQNNYVSSSVKAVGVEDSATSHPNITIMKIVDINKLRVVDCKLSRNGSCIREIKNISSAIDIHFNGYFKPIFYLNTRLV